MSELNQLNFNNNLDNLSELEIFNYIESRISGLENWTNEKIKELNSGLAEYADEMLDNIRLN